MKTSRRARFFFLVHKFIDIYPGIVFSIFMFCKIRALWIFQLNCLLRFEIAFPPSKNNFTRKLILSRKWDRRPHINVYLSIMISFTVSYMFTNQQRREKRFCLTLWFIRIFHVRLTFILSFRIRKVNRPRLILIAFPLLLLLWLFTVHYALNIKNL